MQPLTCRCGYRVYFDNLTCVSCRRHLAFDPHALTMLSAESPDDLAACANRDSASLCNWAVEPGAASGFCLSCRMTNTIPALTKPENLERWRRLEAAKRRLIVDLLQLGLPVEEERLRFVFKEDRRTNPHVDDDHVSTGHESGVITINAAEADDVFREQMRVQMNEPVRTLLGHMRHESGHYYADVVLDDERRADARRLFGDERNEYGPALERYYQSGPPPDWNERFISSYASAHPAEDWAECWGHYLKIRSALLTAESAGLTNGTGGKDWQGAFVDLALAVNEVMRSLGLPFHTATSWLRISWASCLPDVKKWQAEKRP